MSRLYPGTQAIKVSKKYGLFHISCGAVLRDEVATGSRRGIAVAELMTSGDLVPCDVVLDLLKERMMENFEHTRGFIIDGFPIDRSQASRFEKEIMPVTLAIYLKLNHQVMRDRLQGRAVTSGRPDTPAAINRRIKAFRKNDLALYNYFNKNLVVIDAEGDINYVFTLVCATIDDMLARSSSTTSK